MAENIAGYVLGVYQSIRQRGCELNRAYRGVPQSYFLTSHVHLCITDDYAVLLDLRRDTYLAVNRDQMASLAACVRGWPASDSAIVSETQADASQDPVVSKLIAADMLTTSASCGKEARPVQMPRPDVALVIEDLESRPEVRFVDVMRFLCASAIAALSLRARCIATVIANVSARNEAARQRGEIMQLEIARRAVAAFIRLRPLLFGAQDACLFDSLALMRFLSYYRIFPMCVIGVTTSPFGAHCWVQYQAIVFNDAPEYVRRFTPILAV